MPKPNGKTIAVRAAVRTFLRPKLAADSALDIKALIGEVSGEVSESDARKLVTAIRAKAKLARDANLNDLHRVIMDAAKSEEEDVAEDDEDETEEERKKREAEEAKQAADDDDDEKEDEDKKAMDAAIATARKQAEDSAVARMRAIQQAEKDVHPLIGEVAGMDSAEDVYKLALDQAGVDVTDVHPSAYRVLVQQVIASKSRKPGMAADSGSGSEFWKQFNNIKLPARV